MDQFSRVSVWDVIINLVLLGLMAAAVAGAAYYGAKAAYLGVEYAYMQNAIVECEKWQDWELVYPKWDERSETGYFITQWQKDQCEDVGITLDAHVVDYKKN